MDCKQTRWKKNDWPCMNLEKKKNCEKGRETFLSAQWGWKHGNRICRIGEGGIAPLTLNLIVPSMYLHRCWTSVLLRISLPKYTLLFYVWFFLWSQHNHIWGGITSKVIAKDIMLTVLSELLKWHYVIFGEGRSKGKHSVRNNNGVGFCK